MNYGCIGEKLGHSFSKQIHETLAGYEYTLFELARDELESFFAKREFKAVNVTIPYKEAVIPLLDKIDPAARDIGAVNTVVNKDGVLYGYNTDFTGLCDLVRSVGADPRGKKALICGTGGTSRTAEAALKSMGASQVLRVSRTEKAGCITYEEAYSRHSDAEYLINTTPCGMWPDIFTRAVDTARFPVLKGVCDAVYNPLRSLLVTDALERGIPAAGGLYMLVSQAVAASELFTGTKYKSDAVDTIFKKIYSQKENIVLSGMPGSGKTTLGKLISQKTGRKLLDTDLLITEKHGKTPAEIINDFGEEAFRDIESEAIAHIAGENSCVIATGGGAILRPKNVSMLRMNGRIVYLDRNISDIEPTPSRPLSQNRELLEAIYAKRKCIYESVCDIKFTIKGTPQSSADKLLELMKQ